MSHELIDYAAALRILESPENIPAPIGRVEKASLLEAAGRILAEPILADADMPPFARSTRDGYACRAAEAAAGPLRVVGSIRAGDAPFHSPLEPATAIEIMTGAPVPEGADCVVMLEHVVTNEGTVQLTSGRTIASGENVVPRGEEAKQGAELVRAGRRMNAAHIAAAATCGYAEVTVYAQPRVAILSTGDELVDVAVKPAPGQIRNSNAPMLATLVRQAGGEPVILPAVADDAEAIDAAIGEALKEDMILISGGVSAGRFDLVEPVLARRNAKFHFTGVKIQPGKPVVFGQLEDAGRVVPFFGLPGNPISAAVTFRVFASKILEVLTGDSFRCQPSGFVGEPVDRVAAHPTLDRFVPSFFDDESNLVDPMEMKSSGDIASFAHTNCFLLVSHGKDIDFDDAAEIVTLEVWHP